ncbi:integrase family protein [Variovorax paradoxus]|jgi:hypothetical protein|uniref:integrase family protein n=1 Tax=Variovorax paradoxus TaxID=34073 RepID=UPI0029C6D391|nr:integrase family protein [Variovorax paradoxus]WPH22727.1 integrase family protein [Variovorax paradoxus]
MLADTACKKTLCPADKLRLRLADSGGLYLQIEPSGSTRWFRKYRFDGKEKRLALGSYPEVTLKAACTGRDDARNIRQMRWSDLDLDKALWTIPAADMKRTKTAKINGRPHLVPLPTQAVEVLADLKPLTGHGQYVFPSLLTGERPMSDNTVNIALRCMGFDNTEMTATVSERDSHDHGRADGRRARAH